MAGYLSDNIFNAWDYFLVESEYAKNYPVPYSIRNAGPKITNPILEMVLPSLLYIKMVAILDEALDEYIQIKKLTIPTKKYKEDLNGRICFLDDSGLLSKPVELHRIRKKRNSLSHDSSVHVSWTELNEDINVIDSELKHLGFTGERQKLEVFGERTRQDDDLSPDVLFRLNYRVGIKGDGKIRLENKWSEEFYRHGHS